MALNKKRFKLSKFGTRLTRNRVRIESESFPHRPKESELLDHDFAGIVPTLSPTFSNGLWTPLNEISMF